jgi:hypothetical protein
MYDDMHRPSPRDVYRDGCGCRGALASWGCAPESCRLAHRDGTAHYDGAHWIFRSISILRRVVN